MRYIAAGLFGTLLTMAVAHAGTQMIQPIFVPVIVVYQNGSFSTVQLAGDEWFISLRECNESAQREAMKVLEDSTVDRYTSVKVSCLPVPSKNPKVDADAQ